MDGSRILIFMDTKKDVIRSPSSFAWMIGQLFQFMEIKVKQRGTGSSVLSEFKAGKSPIMTATDVAARGLGMEIKLLKLVQRLDRNSILVQEIVLVNDLLIALIISISFWKEIII